jgi:hypothetical protein
VTRDWREGAEKTRDVLSLLTNEAEQKHASSAAADGRTVHAARQRDSKRRPSASRSRSPAARLPPSPSFALCAG